MDLKQLMYFKTIVEEGSILGASKKLFMSQPPLSNQIKLLEEELNCILFERGSRQIALTDEGKLLYERTKTILSLSDITKKEVLNIKNNNSGTIRIGIVSSISSFIIEKYIKSFVKKYSNVKFEIFEANTYQLLEKIKSNLIEIAFVRTPFDDKNLNVFNISNEKLVAIGNKKFFTKNELTLDDLNTLPVIIYRRWLNIINDKITNNKKINYICINDDARTTMEFVNNDLGVGIVPESAAILLNDNYIRKEINDLNIFTIISLISNDNSYISNITKKFISSVTLF